MSYKHVILYRLHCQYFHYMYSISKRTQFISAQSQVCCQKRSHFIKSKLSVYRAFSTYYDCKLITFFV